MVVLTLPLVLVQILALTDTNAEWSKELGLTVDLSKHGLGTRTNRYAIILDDLVVKYVEVRDLMSQCYQAMSHR
jgi:peroxiredoxin